MKALCVALVALIVFTCVSVAGFNELNGTDNVPMTFQQTLDTFRNLSSLFEDQLRSFYGTMDYWANIFSGNYNVKGIIEELDQIDDFAEFWNVFKKYDLLFNFHRSVLNLLVLVFYSIIDGLQTVFSIFRICWNFVVGVPRPVS